MAVPARKVLLPAGGRPEPVGLLTATMNYTVLDSSVAYKGKILSVHLDEIKYESTGRKSKREVVVKDAFAMVLPVMPNGNIVTVRQFRHPFQEMVRVARSSNQRR